MTPPRVVPTIPGWAITDDDGLYVAERTAPLTEYQRQYGAMTEVTARTQDELLLICDAQHRLAQLLATAEFAAPKVRRLRTAPEGR